MTKSTLSVVFYREAIKNRFVFNKLMWTWLLVLSGLFWSECLQAAKKPLIVGIFPRHGYTDNIKMFMPLAKHLEKRLGIPVKLESSRNFAHFWEKVKHKRYDLVHMNQFQYLQAHSQYGYEIIAKNEEYGSSTISSVIIVKKSSPIKTLNDLKGKRIIFGGNRTAMMSYILPKAMLKNAGILTHEYKSLFALNPPNALVAVSLGQADACGVGEAVLKMNYNPAEFRILKRSDPIPHLTWSVRSSLSREEKTRFQQILNTLTWDSNGKAILHKAGLTGIRKTTHSEYDGLNKLIGI